MKLRWLFLSILLTACGTAPKNTAKDSGQIYVDGVSALKASDRNASARDCESAHSKVLTERGNNKEWKPIVRAANTCFAAQKWRQADELAGILSKDFYYSPWGPYYYSLLAEQSGEMERALWMIDLAQKKTQSQVALFHFQKGRILLRMGERASGYQWIEQAIKMDPSLSEAVLFLAHSHYQDMNLESAGRYYQAYLSKNKGDAATYLAYAYVLIESSRHALAVETLATGLRHHPKNVELHVKLAQTFETVTNDYEKALTAYQNLERLLRNGKGKHTLEFDLNEKIKNLEANVSKNKQASVSRGADHVASVTGGQL